MPKHHTEDYKLSAVRYFIRNRNQRETCRIFGCKRRSLMRWAEKYKSTRERPPKNYKT